MSKVVENEEKWPPPTNFASSSQRNCWSHSWVYEIAVWNSKNSYYAGARIAKKKNRQIRGGNCRWLLKGKHGDRILVESGNWASLVAGQRKQKATIHYEWMDSLIGPNLEHSSPRHWLRPPSKRSIQLLIQLRLKLLGWKLSPVVFYR